ncbi:MAG: carboxyltransferase domain-containing protein [Boseongicola sp.]|nr:MAG: carboxyltransferase domain-containing protein [Boseongicola sp.]
MSIKTKMTDPQVLPLGPDGILVRFGEALSDSANRAALAFRGAVEARAINGVCELASSLTSVMIRFQPDSLTRKALSGHLRDLLDQQDWTKAPLPRGRKLWTLPVVFGGSHGPELDETAALANISPDQAIDQICAAQTRVLALGFAPGQPYLGLLDDHWNIPRRADVTAQVPQGAIVVAVRQIIPFANAAPTGWRQIGQTPFKCFDAVRENPIAFTAGDEVTFTPIKASAFDTLAQSPDGLGGATFTPLP